MEVYILIQIIFIYEDFVDLILAFFPCRPSHGALFPCIFFVIYSEPIFLGTFSV